MRTSVPHRRYIYETNEKGRYNRSCRAARGFKRGVKQDWYSRHDTEVYRGQQYDVNLIPMVKVETVVCDVPVDLVMDTARNTLQTGEVGDGKIFVYDVEDAMRIRTGTRGTKAVTDDEA